MSLDNIFFLWICASHVDEEIVSVTVKKRECKYVLMVFAVQFPFASAIHLPVHCFDCAEQKYVQFAE